MIRITALLRNCFHGQVSYLRSAGASQKQPICKHGRRKRRSKNEPVLMVYRVRKKLKKSDPDPEVKLRDYMCEKFYDIRTFGAVMTTFVKASLNCGQTDPGGRCSLAVPGAWTRLWGRWLRSPGRSLPRRRDAENQKSGNGQEEHCTLCLIPGGGATFPQTLPGRPPGFPREDLELL